jgi:hypothetical protein
MTLIPWGMLYVSVVGYSVLTSNLITFFVLAIALTALRIIYASFLYPEYLTPIKHIPTPPVSFSAYLSDVQYLANSTETVMDQGKYGHIRRHITL